MTTSIGYNYIIELLEDGTITLVSYGLAPNPNGFCYEYNHGHLDADKLKLFLDTLTKEETKQLIKDWIY